MNRRFSRLMAVGKEASEEVGEEANEAAVAGVLELRDVFELVNDGLDHAALP